MPARRKLTRPQVERARRLRREMSVGERVFWGLARSGRLGFQFRRQHPYGGYTLDFYCAEAALAVELDGEQHDSARDQRRDEDLRQMGVETMRIPTIDFLLVEPHGQYRNWIELIIRRCEERTGRVVPRE